MYLLPPNNQWTQPNKGDNSGSLWATFNVDLTRKDGVVFGTRLITTSSTSSSETNMGLPIGFVKFDVGGGIANAPYFTVAGARVFDSDNGSLPSDFDESTNTPTTCSSDTSDLAVFNAELYVTTDTNTTYYTSNGSTWNSFTTGSSDTGNPHMLCVYQNRMYMTRANSQIISWDSSRSVATSGTYTMNLVSAGLGSSNENIITFIRSVSNGIYIGTLNQLGRNGRVYFWDGTTANAYTKVYTLKSTGAMACVIQDDVPYIMDNNGRLLALNGGTFIEVSRLPLVNRKTLTNSFSSTNERWIHPNGIAIVNQRININVSLGEMSNSTQNEDNCPSGIWEYDKDIGLYHKHSISYYDTTVGTISDWGQQRTAFSTGSGNETGAGGLAWVQNNSDDSGKNGTLLVGAKYYSDATTTKYGVFFDDSNTTIQTASYIVTSKVETQQIADVWQKFFVRHKKFLTASDKIVVKYRASEIAPVEGTITWTSTTAFSTAVDMSVYSVGDEVEILQGTGGGMCSHITDIQAADGGTYIVTVDETHTNASGTAIVRFQKWIKAGTIQDVGNFDNVLLGITSDWIQLKLFMLWTGKNELRQSLLINTPHKLAV